jgi:uncharacterized protein YjbJ (UPF0337 family)
MNEDIMKGKWLEIKGRVKEKWGKVTDNNFYEIEGKGEKLLGILRKQYGYIRNKTKLEYKDGVELAEIVTRIREILTKKNDIMAIPFIARYGQLFSGKKQKSRITEKEKKHGNDTDPYFDSRLSRRNTHLAP